MNLVAVKNMMQDKIEYAGKTLVVGLGQTGMSVVRYLSNRCESLAVTDSRDIPPGLDELKNDYPDIARFTGRFDELAFLSADRLIVSPGIALTEPMIQQAIDRGIPVLGDIELFAQHVDKPVVVITGSNGKSTVTTLLGLMAAEFKIKAGVGGNIGIPALDLLDAGNEFYILELSSFQLETLSSMHPIASVVLNISEDHMDRYKGIDEYSDVKSSIYQNASVAIVNLDDKRVSKMAADQNKIYFSMSEPNSENDFGICNQQGQQWLCQGSNLLCNKDDLLIAGDHNVANALAALALGQASGFSNDAMLKALKSFKGLIHRTQFVAKIDNVNYYNDSKATNVGACIAALEGLAKNDDSKSVVILGGESKDADFSELTSVIQSTCSAAILIGRDAKLVEKFIPSTVRVILADTLLQAVTQAKEVAKSGDRVLLSPACASFDMFKNFEDRGDQFIQIVQGLEL